MTDQIDGPGALADAPEAEKHVDISRFQDSSLSGRRPQPNQPVLRRLIQEIASLVVEQLAGYPPSVIVRVLVNIESLCRQHLLDLGFSRTDALTAGENLRCLAFDELELIWDNLTWAKGGRRPGWSIYSQPEQLSKLRERPWMKDCRRQAANQRRTSSWRWRKSRSGIV